MNLKGSVLHNSNCVSFQKKQTTDTIKGQWILGLGTARKGRTDRTQDFQGKETLCDTIMMGICPSVWLRTYKVNNRKSKSSYKCAPLPVPHVSVGSSFGANTAF